MMAVAGTGMRVSLCFLVRPIARGLLFRHHSKTYCTLYGARLVRRFLTGNCPRFVGESEGALRQTFAEASENAPCLIVFDEVDTLCPRRDQAGSEAQRRVVSTMLALLDGIDAQEQVGRVVGLVLAWLIRSV